MLYTPTLTATFSLQNLILIMGPIRGGLRKKRRVEKKAKREVMINGFDGGDWWVNFFRRITGSLTLSKALDDFVTVFKISRKTFNYICSLIREDLMEKPSNYIFSDGKALSVEDQVAVALRRLGSGESLVNIGTLFGLNHSTVSQVTWRFVEVMEEKALHHLQWPNSNEGLETIKSKFEKIRGLPNCCGAIDTTHIMMCLPTMDSTSKVWLDYSKNHSMVLQVIVDPDMRFRDIVTGWPGIMEEFLVLRNSSFFKLCEKGERLNGRKGEYIIGDEAFPLLPWLLTPYQGKEISETEEEFNKRHFATRMVAQRALARLKEMWKIVQGEMWRPDRNRLPRIILVCCMLHNIVIDLEDEVTDEMPLSHNHDASYKQRFCNFVDKEGSALRDEISQFLPA